MIINMRKKDICIDFDGVLNTYTGWQGENELFEMREGCDRFLAQVSEIYNVIIFTTRNADLIWLWLKKYNLEKFVKQVTNIKIPAEIYLDDRAINFEGDFDKIISEISNFIPHWKK